jgi:hypothetical protein
MNLRGLDICHVWPNIPTALTLNTGTTTVTIASGNWTATELATYLTSQLVGPESLTFTYDDSFLGFTISGGTGLNIISGSTAQSVLGFVPGTTYANQTKSVQPINLMGPGSILVKSNLSLHTLPISGLLSVVPITGNYGSLITYRDPDGGQPILVTQSDLHNLEIQLTDENGTLLNGYDSIPWRMILSIELLHAPGYVNPSEQHGVGLPPLSVPIRGFPT